MMWGLVSPSSRMSASPLSLFFCRIHDIIKQYSYRLTDRVVIVSTPRFFESADQGRTSETFVT